MIANGRYLTSDRTSQCTRLLTVRSFLTMLPAAAEFGRCAVARHRGMSYFLMMKNMRMSVKAKSATTSIVFVTAGIVGTVTNVFIVPAEVLVVSIGLSLGIIAVLTAVTKSVEIFTGWLTGIVLAWGLFSLLVGVGSIIEMLIKR